MLWVIPVGAAWCGKQNKKYQVRTYMYPKTSAVLHVFVGEEGTRRPVIQGGNFVRVKSKSLFYSRSKTASWARINPVKSSFSFHEERAMIPTPSETTRHGLRVPAPARIFSNTPPLDTEGVVTYSLFVFVRLTPTQHAHDVLCLTWWRQYRSFYITT